MTSPPPDPPDGGAAAGSNAGDDASEGSESIQVVSLPAMVPTLPPADGAAAAAGTAAAAAAARPRRGGRPVRRPTHDSFASHHSDGSGGASVLSGIVRSNSISFERDSSYYSDDDGSASGKSRDMEVMDLRSNSFASLGSNGSGPGVDADTLFRVASKYPNLEGAAPSAGEGPPRHWAHTAENKKTYRALMDMIKGGGKLGSREGARSSGGDGRSWWGNRAADDVGSDASFVLPRYDFQEPSEEQSQGSSKMSESSSKLSESSPLSREKRLRRTRRKLYVKRCAKAMMVLVALAALSLSAIYLTAEDPDAVLGAFVARVFGEDPDAHQRSLPQDRASDDLEGYVDELSRREEELAKLLRANAPASPRDSPGGEGADVPPRGAGTTGPGEDESESRTDDVTKQEREAMESARRKALERHEFRMAKRRIAGAGARRRHRHAAPGGRGGARH